jgi:hypothetical protein
MTHTVTCSHDGSFTDTLTPDTAGRWSVTASWQGHNEHSGATSTAQAFTVTEQPVLTTWMRDIVAAVVVVGKLRLCLTG